MYTEEQSDIRDTNHDILNEFFQNQEDWIMEYVQSDDYMDGYSCLLHEGVAINDRVRLMLQSWYYHALNAFDNARNECGISNDAQLPDDFYEYVVDAILYYNLYSMDCADEYDSSRRFYLDCFTVGEYENQIDMQSLWDNVNDKIIRPNTYTTLSDIVKEYIETNRKHCLRTSGLLHQHAKIEQYVNTGLRIDFYLTSEQFEQVTTLAIIKYCKQHDSNRRDRVSVKS